MIPALVLAFLPHFVTPEPNRLVRVVNEMTLPGVEVDVEVISCGQANAFYSHRARSIYVCRELLLLPHPVVRFVVAHEMAHAIIAQLDIPVPGSEEAAADELAAVALEMNDDAEAVEGAAIWWEGRAAEPDDAWDDHPSAARRAATLICLDDGANENPLIADCADRYSRALIVWSRLITEAVRR